MKREGRLQKWGKYAATVGSPDNLDELMEMGYRFMNLGADVLGLAFYCLGLVKRYETYVESNTMESKNRTDNPYK